MVQCRRSSRCWWIMLRLQNPFNEFVSPFVVVNLQSPKFCVKVTSFVSGVFSRLGCFPLFPTLAAQESQEESPSSPPYKGGPPLPKELLAVYRASVSMIVQPIMLKVSERTHSRRHQRLAVKRKASAAGYSRARGSNAASEQSNNSLSGNSTRTRRESCQDQAQLLSTQCLSSLFAAIFGDLVSLLYLDNREPVLFNLVVLSSCGIVEQISDVVRRHTGSASAGARFQALEPCLDSLNVLRLATQRRQASYGPLATLISPRPVLLRTCVEVSYSCHCVSIDSCSGGWVGGPRG